MEVAKALARLKADSVLEMEPGAIVIGADQVLSIGMSCRRSHKTGRRRAISF